MSRYPLWKYLLLIVVAVWAIIYSLPNLYGEEPAVQVSGRNGLAISDTQITKITDALAKEKIAYRSMQKEGENSVLFRFNDVNVQLKAQHVMATALGDDYTTALNLAPAIPAWLSAIGAEPMKLGLDLRGGVHFLMMVDVNTLLERRINGDLRNIREELRGQHIRFKEPRLLKDNRIVISFRTSEDLQNAQKMIGERFPELVVAPANPEDPLQMTLQMSPSAIFDAQNYAVEQTITVLRNRVNELGISEPIVQREGSDRVVVDLPGIQDTARAKEIVGGTATVEMHLQDLEHDAILATQNNSIPPSSKLYNYRGVPILLQRNVILSGSSITGASSGMGEDGRSSVNVRLGGGGEALFYRVTGENVGKPMAIVFVETRMDTQTVNGKTVTKPRLVERILSVATIQSALGNAFQITGLTSGEESKNLALMLRAGALPAPISFLEESTVGPSLGQENIRKGIISVLFGFSLIVVFMAIYYRLFGLIADVALALNLLLLAAILSIIGQTLTLPAIASIVLTLGMAVDANVLIFERIREELRNGVSPHASIHAGFERAFSTIIDANVTTLIAAVALFTLGSGAVKGFAIVLIIGLLTSMFTQLTGVRALIYLAYSGRSVKKLNIGI